MVFNSLIFLSFLSLVLSLYYRLDFGNQNRLLLIASYIFYGWWDWRFAFLLLGTTWIDYYLAHRMEDSPSPRVRRYYVSASIVANLTVLGVFKYFNFFAESFVHVAHVLGFSADVPTLQIILPLGISFYTFLSMSYVIDVYRRDLLACRRFDHYALFVSFFPHLVAGPIVRASYLIPQCAHRRLIDSRQVVNGSALILVGYVKKVVIADRMAVIANWGFDHPLLSDVNPWLPVLAFAIQIYGDFSGYSDIARGVSKLMGFELPQNFGHPYLVSNPSEFWRHWHITLSTWLRDYLYIPLGGNRRGPARTYINLMLTMVIGGFWHGAGTAYLAWGLYHGILLCVYRAGGQVSRRAGIMRDHYSVRWIRAVFFSALTLVGWLIFRSGSAPASVNQLALIGSYLQAMFSWPLRLDALFWPILVLGGLALWFQAMYQRLETFVDWPVAAQAALVSMSLLLIATCGVFEGAQFIYFQF